MINSDDEDESDEPQPKKTRSSYKASHHSPDYKSLHIVVDDVSLLQLSSQDINSSDDEEENGSTDQIHYVLGDVTKPESNTTGLCRFIINCVSDYGVWGKGGLFSAIDKLSDLPKKAYEEAGRNDDLHCGDAQLVNVQDDLYVINVVAQRHSKSSHSGILLHDLTTALYKGLCLITCSTT